MTSIRQNKVSRLVQKELSEIFQRDLSHLGNGAMISVTMVRISHDLGIARVYLSVFPSKGLEEVIDNISNRAGEVRRLLGNTVRHQLRKVPELHFYGDDSLDYAEKIDDLLKPNTDKPIQN